MASSKNLSHFEPLTELNGVFVASKGGLRCTAIRLTDNSLCLFSPVLGLGIEALASLDALGRVSYLLAPNHYHHLGLTEYAAAFPQASLCAADGAIPRLQKLAGLEFTDLSALSARLPKTMTILEPAGLKTGEVWVRCQQGATVAWLVVDAIAGPKVTTRAQRFERPEYLTTFPSYGVRDRDVYRAWFTGRLAADQPTLVVPCHGGVLAAADLPARLSRMDQEMWR
jgi:hypothetical protein